MKQILSLTLALVLTAALFTGCGCSANVSTHPGGMITEDTQEPAIMPHPTATHETTPRETRPTVPQDTTQPHNPTLPAGTTTPSVPEDTGSIPGTTRSPGNTSR